MSCHTRTHVPKLKHEFSEAEKIMFEELGWSHSFEDHILIHGFYSMVVEDVFLHNKQGLAVDALRRAMFAITKGLPARKTKEFDELITLKPIFDFDYDSWVLNHDWSDNVAMSI